MKWATTITAGDDLRGNIANAFDSLNRDLGGQTPDLVLVFCTSDFREGSELLLEVLEIHWPGIAVAGCTAMGVVGPGTELEQKPGIAIAAAVLPDVEVAVSWVDLDRLPDEDAPPDEWRRAVGMADWDEAELILLVDPFTSELETFVSGLDYAWPDGTKVGGLASGGGQAGENLMIAGGEIHHSGAVVVGLRGNVTIDAVVAQGCRPIGDPLTVTCSERNLVLELDGQTPVKCLQDLLPTLSEYDRTLLTSSLFLGIQMDPFKNEPGAGDYLVRNLIGVDYEAGVMAVGAQVHEGQIVQFHLRDQQTSAEDLQARLNQFRSKSAVTEEWGALMFSCIGRGEYLYGESGHDVRMFEATLGNIPVAGMFCNGELGPVGGTTYVHGYTSSFGLIRPSRTAE